MSHTTAEQYDAIQRKGTEEQKQAVSNGEASIKKVYTAIQKAERLKKNKAIEQFYSFSSGLFLKKSPLKCK